MDDQQVIELHAKKSLVRQGGGVLVGLRVVAEDTIRSRERLQGIEDSLDCEQME